MKSVHQAALDGNIPLLEQLLTELNVKDAEGSTSLYRAAENGRLDAVKYLLERGADVMAKDNYGRTALFMAAANGHEEVVQVLLEVTKGVVDHKCQNCRTTALSKAAGNGHSNVVKSLLRRGALQSANVLGLKPAELAGRNGYHSLSKELKEETVEETALRESLAGRLVSHIEERHLEMYFPGGEDGGLEAAIGPAIKQSLEAVKHLVGLGLGKELAQELALLTLYDVVLLLDDSESMRFSEGRKRIPALKESILSIVTLHAALSFEAPGTPLSKKGVRLVRFINSKDHRKGVTTENDVSEVMKLVKPRGVTKIGTALKEKILDPLFYDTKKPQLKPLLIMVITDGEVEGEASNVLEKTILGCIEELQRRSAEATGDSEDSKRCYGVAFQFTQIGNDRAAERFLHELDEHPNLRDFVACAPAGLDVNEVMNESDDSTWERVTRLMVGAVDQNWKDGGSGPADEAEDEDI